ncbi:hypothetical protein ACP275_05G050800 [Erythranthe tilingii]
MKKAKQEDEGNNSRISDLPKDILHRILYFLSQEDAVRTSLLSKSWRYVWCTRPNLDFSDNNFKGNKNNFLSVVDKTLQLYRDQNLCLEEFHLSISLTYYWDCTSVPFLDKWIPLLATMGVKEFRLSVVSNHGSRMTRNLPSVVYKAESLNLLRLERCNLVQNIPEKIPFVRLQVLRLQTVSIEQEIFDKIISSCPLLTDMWFQECKGLTTIKLETKLHKHLKHFTFISNDRYIEEKRCIEIDIPTLETIKINGSKIRVNIRKFGNLKSLTLKRVEFYSNNSIEQSHQLLIDDAPNMEYFYYSGCFIPSISSAPNCRESYFKLFIWDDDDDVEDSQSWFPRLSKLLQALRHSEISLNIFHHSVENIPHVRHDVINGGDNNKPVAMEHLRLSSDHVRSLMPLLNGLFCICRPRNVDPKWLEVGPEYKESERKELSEFWFEIQEMRESGNREIWQEDLEDLNIESFDSSRKKWQPFLHATRLSEESAFFPDFGRMRLRLKWRESL